MTDTIPKDQRRGKAIAMSAEERDEFLASERTCRLATVGGDGAPHVTPLWYVWDGASLWITSLVRSQRWTDVQRDNRVSVVIDAGDEFLDLRGVEMNGIADPVGEAPRTGEPVPSSTSRAAPRRQVPGRTDPLRRPPCVASNHAHEDPELGLPQDQAPRAHVIAGASRTPR